MKKKVLAFFLLFFGFGCVPEKPVDVSSLSSVEKISHAQDLFARYCSSCHGRKGLGKVGPNLADAFWLHGNGSRESIAKSILMGAPQKGMPSWQGRLGSQEVEILVDLILSLKNSNSKQGKKPQGTFYGR